MPSYLHPGVYVEEIPSGSKPIEAAGTSTACFIGFTTKGHVNNNTTIGNGVFEAELINKWDDYDSQFGGITAQETSTSGALPMGDPMGHSVYAFFRNGGSKAYIIRVATGGVKSAGSYDNAGDSSAMITFTAANEGAWGDQLIVRMTPKAGTTSAAGAEFTVDVGKGTISSGEITEFSVLESFTDVSLDSAEPAYIENKINDSSELVEVSVSDGAAAATQLIGETNGYGFVEFGAAGSTDGADGVNGSDGGTSDYDAVFTALLKYRDVNIICLPGKYYNRSSGATAAESDMADVIDSAVSHCARMKNRMVIVDPPYATEFEKEKDVSDLSLPTASTYTALYYPWVKVSNPHYDAEKNPGAATRVIVPPSAFAAGMWAKIDAKRGVWKAPAGIETSLLGAAGFEYVVEDAEQDYLNPVAVNCLRTLPNYGRVIWGSRTLATRSDPEWRYIPVRRTAMLIEESIFNGIQWAVFEPNNHNLWAALRNNISSFMNGMFRAGAFQGEKASDAYFVRCGLGDTMTQGDIDRGQVIVIVGFAPLKPAEFVIVRIQQKVGQE